MAASSTKVPVLQPVVLHDCLTVHATVDAGDSRPETVQALVSQWRSPDTWPGFAAFDAADTDGLPSRGYFGAVFDGRYVYFVPEQHGEPGKPTHGVVLRYDTHGDFRDRASYQAYDASRTDGLETRGFYGAVFDGRYVYFVPRQIDMAQYHSRVLRLDTQGAFKDPGSWAAFDVGEAHSQQGAAFDGRYIYFCPGFTGDPTKENEHCGRVIRFDTQGDFKSRSSYTSVDIARYLGPQASCFDGGAFDGRYIYLVPLYSGVAVRYDTTAPFEAPRAWESHDLRPYGYQLAVGAVFDGTYLYYCAYAHARIVRFDTRRPFGDPAAWESHHADPTGGLRTTGFDGGFFDGRFVYFQPFFLHVGPGKRDNKFHSHYLRYEVTRPFSDPASWQSFDASATDGLPSVGYNAGAFDGRFFYAAPWQQGPKPDKPGEFITHGIVLRCDTLGHSGSFSLRYGDCGHNGGLNAAVIGPSFLVNTEHGCLSVSHPQPLPPGLHHLAGVYDGKIIKLFVDGTLVARRAGSGRILNCDLPVTIGRLQDGAGVFHGRVLNAVIDAVTVTDTEVCSMAHYELGQARAARTLRLELDTYFVLDGRPILRGAVHLPADHGRWVRLTATARDTGAIAWQHTRSIAFGMDHLDLEMPVQSMPGGYYLVEAVDDLGRRSEVNLVLREEQTSPVARAVSAPDFLAEAKAVVDHLLAEQSCRLADRSDGELFITVGRPTGIGYRSLGHQTGDTFQTYWFPEETFEYDTFRADHDLWPVLDALSRHTGDPRYRALTAGMIDAIGRHGFDPRSGLLLFSEECDFNVRTAAAHSKRMASDQPKFKPINGSPSTDMHIERFWQRLPEQTHRWLRATYYGLVTNPATMDYNRFCMYGFDDRARIPSLTTNAGHCAFETAGASMIYYWASCWAYAEDRECLSWAQQMADKWAAVQDATSGLMPNFFGAVGWNPGGAQPPGQWAETRSAAMASVNFLRAAQMLRRRRGAEALADHLQEMGRRAALGVARYAYDWQQAKFREHLHLDGRPYEDTARYCFRTQAEKDAAVARDQKMAQVAVYSGEGFYRHPSYYSYQIGSGIPHHLAKAAALCRDPELIERLGPMADTAVGEAAGLCGAFTSEGRWTFRATAWHAQLCIHLHRITGDPRRLQQARELATRELAALKAVRFPHWWRLRDRADWLNTLLMLHEASASP